MTTTIFILLKEGIMTITIQTSDILSILIIMILSGGIIRPITITDHTIHISSILHTIGDGIQAVTTDGVIMIITITEVDIIR